MNPLIKITTEAINTAAVLASVQSHDAGASVLFVGTTRKLTGDKETLKLDYQCYQEMAIKKMAEILDEAKKRWKIVDCSIVHRVGTVALGEASIAVAVSSPHRVASFESAQWMVDTLKRDVPIWKREYWADGSTEWVHPDGVTPGEMPKDQ